MKAKNTKTTKNQIDACELLETLEITSITPRMKTGGAWVRGKIAGHRFDALIFRGHADFADYELESSRISKLWVQRIEDRVTVANFDRGWDIRPTTEMAKAIVGLFAAGLAEHVHGE